MSKTADHGVYIVQEVPMNNASSNVSANITNLLRSPVVSHKHFAFFFCIDSLCLKFRAVVLSISVILWFIWLRCISYILNIYMQWRMSGFESRFRCAQPFLRLLLRCPLMWLILKFQSTARWQLYRFVFFFLFFFVFLYKVCSMCCLHTIHDYIVLHMHMDARSINENDFTI